MLAIPLPPNINSSLSKFLKSEVLESENKWFCPSCDCLTQSNRETSIINSGCILVIQLLCFSISHSRLRKDQMLFNYMPESELNVPITGSWSIFFQQTLSYDIHNHWSTLDQEHYWVVIKDWNLGNWLSCNDNVVLTVPQHVLNTSNSYILFYKKI